MRYIKEYNSQDEFEKGINIITDILENEEIISDVEVVGPNTDHRHLKNCISVSMRILISEGDYYDDEYDKAAIQNNSSEFVKSFFDKCIKYFTEKDLPHFGIEYACYLKKDEMVGIVNLMKEDPMIKRIKELSGFSLKQWVCYEDVDDENPDIRLLVLNFFDDK